LTVRKRVAQLEKQPPQHTHKGDEVLFEIPGKEQSALVSKDTNANESAGGAR